MAQFLRMCHNMVDLRLSSAMYREVLGIFPCQMQMAFAYGSGVFQQLGGKDKSHNVLDFIFVVDEPVRWHRENIKKNPRHYSALRWLGPAAVSKVQEYGAGTYFNTLIPFQEREIKYGVISTKRLIRDLLDWDALYISGRLHKPVRLLQLPESVELSQALQINLASALHAALLMLPSKFSEEDLYLTISSLSYVGDLRMKVGEDRNKIANIVKPNMEHFRRMYEPFLEKEDHILWNKATSTIEQTPYYVTNFHHLNMLPKAVQEGLLLSRYTHGRFIDMEEMIRMLANDSNCGEIVRGIIASLIHTSSWTQTTKGVLTAGLLKSVRYASRKVKKAISSRRSKPPEVKSLPVPKAPAVQEAVDESKQKV